HTGRTGTAPCRSCSPGCADKGLWTPPYIVPRVASFGRYSPKPTRKSDSFLRSFPVRLGVPAVVIGDSWRCAAVTDRNNRENAVAVQPASPVCGGSRPGRAKPRDLTGQVEFDAWVALPQQKEERVVVRNRDFRSNRIKSDAVVVQIHLWNA